MKIAIIDYGMGNLRSVEKAFAYLGYTAQITSDPQALRQADRVVLPGVGAFGDGMRELHRRGLIDVIKELIADSKPVLGICLGLQLLFNHSEEAPGVEGLGIIPGRVTRFKKGITVPHMGWNQIRIKRTSPIFDSIPSEAYFYFVHSYYVVPEDDSVILTTTEYDVEFVSMINRGNLFAAQFHPEKSQKVGLQMLKNFASL
ncbi:imidazole glycerol phosphate synthase subunit HisH [Candidatus Sumerlaeota bacterium]|nr:imidazole glycerol phosphate synthase subunit HisH [Candidatus Sumerlaeota bacterium]